MNWKKCRTCCFTISRKAVTCPCCGKVAVGLVDLTAAAFTASLVLATFAALHG
ncbi:MAG TPA: hypothetical protein VNX25_10275 [Verrucomicrobiae bacterium]|nr:hypothetical protein [Verrucomicrobiae bacterium]